MAARYLFNNLGRYVGQVFHMLVERTSFRLLGLIGEAVGAGPLETANAFLDLVAAEKTEGGWVVIGCALGKQLDRDPASGWGRRGAGR